MSTKRTGSPKVSRGTTTTVGPGGLSAEEERALRMRFGLAGDDDLALPDKAEGNAAVLAQLRAIERRAFAMTGRGASGSPETKSKIVSALQDKATPPKPRG